MISQFAFPNKAAGLFTILLLFALYPWAQLSAQVDVTLTDITGKRYDTSLLSIDSGMLKTAEDQLALDQLLMIGTAAEVLQAQQPIVVGLAPKSGTLGATHVDFVDEKFRISTAMAGEIVLPPDCVSHILFKPDADLSRFQRAIENRAVDRDIVIAKTKNGQGLVRGIIESIESERLILNYDGKSRPISLSKIVGIVTADLGAERALGQAGSIRTVEGDFVKGAISGFDGTDLIVGIAANRELRFPIEHVTTISLESDRVKWLSDLEPADVSMNSLATLEFVWQRDLNVYRKPLRLYSFEAGRAIEYSRGIGMHSACRLEFVNTDDFNRFAALVGIDAGTEGKGDCEVSVWGDGIKLWESRITGAMDAKNIDIDIRGMNRIALVVRNGNHLDLADHVNWVDARFLKTAE